MSYSITRRGPMYGIILIVLALGIYAISHFHRTSSEDKAVTIVLSPHFDDAVLSLGGLISQNKQPTIVATFFNHADRATSTPWDEASGFTSSTQAEQQRAIENAQALKLLDASTTNYAYDDSQYDDGDETAIEQDLTRSIQSLIASFGNKDITIYGPAYFGKDITHKDHARLHAAFINVARGYPKSNVHFLIYEDYPYIDHFNKAFVESLQKYLEDTDDISLTTIELPLSQKNVEQKIDALNQYTSQIKAFKAQGISITEGDKHFTESRCGSEACEVVYSINQSI